MLQLKYAVSAVYEIGLTMATTAAKDKLHAEIIFKNRPIGFIQYDFKPPQLEDGAFNGTDLLGGKNNAIQTLSTIPSAPPSSTSSTLSARRSGTAKNPQDPRFEIYYEFLGKPVNKSALFAAFVEAIAAAARHDDNLPGGELYARSPDLRVSIFMRRGARTATFTWGDVKNALAILWRQIIVNYATPHGAAWEDVMFLISYKGRAIGEGFINTH